MGLNKSICTKCVRNVLKQEFNYVLVNDAERYVGESYIACPVCDWKLKLLTDSPPENCLMKLEQILSEDATIEN